MMYDNKLVVAIKHDGKVLREFKDSVYLPFGSEYSIFIKNLNTVRASVKVHIDGEDATEGVNLVIDANDSVDLERFIKGGNLNAGNRFKFIKATANTAKYRGVRAEDGLIRVEFQFEKRTPYYASPTPYWPPGYRGIVADASGSLGNICNNSVTYNSATSGIVGSNSETLCSSVYDSDQKGFTAPGSISHQGFHLVSSLNLESESHVIVARLVGQDTTKKKVTKSVSVKTKLECTSCGHKNRSSTKFCSECGTSLQIVGKTKNSVTKR